MKNTTDLKEEILTLKNEISELDKLKDKKSITLRKRLRGNLPLLKEYLLYLETNPTKDYIQKESDKITNRIKEIMKLYTPLEPANHLRSVVTKHKKAFEKQWEIPKLKKQLAAISYLLK